jgi:deazaflavin-dependent oxidoreductase (nitroreductase family)
VARRGKSKEGRAALRIVRLAFLVSADFHAPLLHRTDPGNRPDAPTLARRAVLEVMRHDPATNTCIIASGFGERADSYRNLMAHPEARIELGGKRIEVRTERLSSEEAEREMVDHGQRNPRAARLVAKLIGYEHDGSDEDLRALAGVLPLVRLRPLGAGLAR